MSDEIQVDWSNGSPLPSSIEVLEPRSMLAPGGAGHQRTAGAWNTWLLMVAGRGRPPRVTPQGVAALVSTPQRTRPKATRDALALAPAEKEAPASVLADRVELVDAPAWEKLWLAIERRPWQSLAVLPIGGAVRSIDVARALAAVGSRHLGDRVQAVDATDLTLEQVPVSKATWMVPRGDCARVVLAVASVRDNPAALALARATDAAVLCLSLGESSIAVARRTIAEVGKDRFLGSILVGGRGDSK